MLKLILTLFVFAIFFTTDITSQNVYDVEGYLYVGGNAGCTITWDTDSRVFKVYWDDGTGYTLLFIKETFPNGNVEYEEYESDGSTYTGSFIFRDSKCETGKYIRKDGKSFTVKR